MRDGEIDWLLYMFVAGLLGVIFWFMWGGITA